MKTQTLDEFEGVQTKTSSLCAPINHKHHLIGQ